MILTAEFSEKQSIIVKNEDFLTIIEDFHAPFLKAKSRRFYFKHST